MSMSWLLLVACVPPEPAPDPDPVASGLTLELDGEFESLIHATWEQSAGAESWVEYRLEGEESWSTTPVATRPAGVARQLVLGVPYGAVAEVRVGIGSPDAASWSETGTITTGPLPTDAPEAKEVTGDPARWDPETRWLFLSLAGRFGSWFLIVDREGRVVWTLPSGNERISLQPRVSRDGTDLLVDENSYWAAFDDGAASQVLRMKIDGTIVEAIDVPGLHHPFTDLPDGSIAYPSMISGHETLDIRAPDGTIRTVWDCQDLLDAVGDRGYCASNTLWYNPADGHLLNSLYATETIVDVDVATGTAVRWFGHTSQSWAFDPPESAFWWQHGGYITAAGTLLTSSKGEDSAAETVVREYEIDSANSTLREVWSFGTGEGIYGDIMGEAHRLPGGNTLHNLGSAIQIREITPEGEVVWDIRWRADILGRSTPISDLYALLP